MFTGKKIAFIGGGKMGSILARAMIRRKIVPSRNITITDIDQLKLKELGASLKVQVSSDNKKAVREADIILLAVKPQQFEVLKNLRPAVNAGKLFISIAAGVPTSAIEKLLTKSPRVVRVMPNVNALAGQGAAAVAVGKFAKKEDVNYALAIFNAVGMAVEVDEKLMDAVTGLSGSGPAYCFVMIEALADAGVQLGLTRELAEKLAAQTMARRGSLCFDRRQHPAATEKYGPSPGELPPGFEVLEDKNSGTLIDAVRRRQSVQRLADN